MVYMLVKEWDGRWYPQRMPLWEALIMKVWSPRYFKFLRLNLKWYKALCEQYYGEDKPRTPPGKNRID